MVFEAFLKFYDIFSKGSPSPRAIQDRTKAPKNKKKVEMVLVDRERSSNDRNHFFPELDL